MARWGQCYNLKAISMETNVVRDHWEIQTTWWVTSYIVKICCWEVHVSVQEGLTIDVSDGWESNSLTGEKCWWWQIKMISKGSLI